MNAFSRMKFFQIFTSTFSTVLNCERQLHCNHQLEQENEMEKIKERGEVLPIPTLRDFFIPTTKSRYCWILCTVLPYKSDFIAVFARTCLWMWSFRAEFQCFPSQSFNSHASWTWRRITHDPVKQLYLQRREQFRLLQTNFEASNLLVGLVKFNIYFFEAIHRWRAQWTCFFSEQVFLDK